MVSYLGEELDSERDEADRRPPLPAGGGAEGVGMGESDTDFCHWVDNSWSNLPTGAREPP